MSGIPGPQIAQNLVARATEVLQMQRASCNLRARLLLPVLALVATAAAGTGTGRADPVLVGRTSDFIEIQGSELSSLGDPPIDRMELLAMNGGRLEPIPFQVDERVEVSEGRREWALPEGPKGGTVRDDGRVDADDELVFMAIDLGPPAGREILAGLPSPAVRIRVTDPLDGAEGVAYLAVAGGTPRLSETDYVDYALPEDVVDTPVYTVRHSKVFPIAHNQNVVKRAAGGEGLDLIDIFKQRILIKAFFGTLKLERRANHWTSDISAYKDGPVRVIRRNENHLFITKNIKSPTLYTQTFYLRDTFWFPAEVNVPFRLSTLVTSLDIYGATEFCHNAVGMEFFSNSEPEGVLFDGITSPQEAAMDREVNQDWQLVRGTQGTWMNRIVMGPGLEQVHRWLYYTDDARTEDPPEEEPGMFGKVGLRMSGLEKLKGGRYTFRSYIHFPEHFRDGDERRILNLLDHPLGVRIEPVNGTP